MFSIHGIGGIIGTLLTAVFASPGLGGVGTVAENGFAGQFLAQLTGVAAVLAWSGGISFLVLKLLDKTLGLRVTPMEETQGLDIALHNEQGYNL